MRRRRRVDRARPAPATRVLLEPDDVPVGLTLAEVQSVMGGFVRFGGRRHQGSLSEASGVLRTLVSGSWHPPVVG